LSVTTSMGNIIVDFEIKAITGSSSLGAYVLKFSVKYSIPAYKNLNAFFHKTIAKVYVGSDQLYLGLATPENPMTFKTKDTSQRGHLLYEIILAKDVLEDIERYRKGKDIEFCLEIIGEYYDGSNLLCDSQAIRFKANQGIWIETLKSMGFKGGIVFELPMDIHHTDEVSAALTAIEIAKEQLHMGNYDDVVAKCRIALESIVSIWGNISLVRKSAKSDRKGMTKQQRFFHVVDQLVHFTNLAHHPDKNGNYIPFNRSEAVFVLGSTIAAISSYVETNDKKVDSTDAKNQTDY
jgi:hypothetical protein